LHLLLKAGALKRYLLVSSGLTLEASLTLEKKYKESL